jgi:hypothetical protein
MYGLARIYARLDLPQITDTQGLQTHKRDGQKACHCGCHMDEGSMGQCICGRCNLIIVACCATSVDDGAEKLLCEEEKIWCSDPHRCAD